MAARERQAGSAAVLADVVAEGVAADRRAALRALLRTPLLTASHPAFPLVRQHREHLREWLAEQAGWHLTVDTEHARLHKTPAGAADHTRPATGPRSGRPLSRRRYVLWCLALAGLERADSQTTLGWLAERILDLAAAPELAATGISFTMDRRAERSDLVEVVRMLLELGVIARVAGDEEAYLADTGDALYDVNRRVLASLLPGVRGPSTMRDAHTVEQRLAALVAEPMIDSDQARLRDARQRLTRRLLDDPVVYRDDVADHELAYLDLPGQRHATARRVADATGLVPELREEGIAMLDPTGETSDASMPAQGTQGHATLLLAEHLAATPQATMAEIDRLVAAWSTTYPWSKAARQEGAAAGIARTAVTQLEALGLAAVEASDDGATTVTARPAIMRYAVDDPTVSGGTPTGPTPSLFDT